MHQQGEINFGVALILSFQEMNLLQMGASLE